MKILIVTSSFYPELSPRSFRATELVKEFYNQGHEVSVFTKKRDADYTEFLRKYPVKFRMWGKNIFPEMPEFKRKPFSIIGRIITRLLMLFFEYPGIEEMLKVKNILRKEKDYDLLISFALPYPVHWGVSRIRSADHPVARTWVADCGDPYMFARLDTFRKPFYFRYFEKRFCRRCDYISVPFGEMANQFYPEFRSKIKVIPQGFNFGEIRLCKEKPINERPVIVFAGSVIQGKRDLTLFLDFLFSESIDFKLLAYTRQKEWFNKYKLALGDKIILNDLIDRLSLIYEMSKADFLVNVDTVHDSTCNTEAVPSKLIDYALAGRPILNLNSANLDKELVLEFLSGNYSRQRKINLSDHDIRKVANQFIDLVKCIPCPESDLHISE